MASFPFYSPVVRKALDIISNHEDFAQVSLSSKINDDDESSFNLHTTNNSNAEDNLRVGGTAAIRGKWSGGYASSSSDDEAADKEDDDASNTSESDDYDSSTSISACSTSLGGVVGENEESKDSNNIAHEKQRTIAAVANATNTKKQQSKKNKKYKNKKSKDMVSKMGKAPTVLLPYCDNSSDTNIKKKEIGRSDNRVLEVPNVILPINYINNNPSYQISSMAKTLLSTWEELNNKIHPPTIIVVLLQSGRFASAVFTLQQSATNNGTSKKNNNNNNITMQMLCHKTSTRYTVRKGQGGAQSSHDQGKHKAKSIGAQLRREGEKQLRSDVHETWVQWNQLGYIDKALWVYVSCPKSMKRDYLHINDGSSGLLKKNDARWRNVPLDVGRPTLEATSAVLDCVLNCHVRDMTEKELADLAAGDDDDEKENTTKNDDEKKTETLSEQSKPEEKEVAPPPPFTPVHEAVFNGDLSRLLELLAELNESEQQQVDETDNIDQSVKTSFDYDVDTCGGPDNQTALHIAASSTCSNATSLINALLIQGHANPCVIDARGRPPYFLANSDKIREAFRLARGTLGEDYCSWDDGAKVGPALSEDDVQLKKAKALEKKRRQRARQKEKKAIEKAEAEAVATKERAELEKKKQEEDAKRIRDGLKPKHQAQNACDFCHKIVKGKRRSQMFQRLEYAYCSTDCVKKHQRELMAAAAVARFSNN